MSPVFCCIANRKRFAFYNQIDYNEHMNTIAETKNFSQQAAKFLTENEYNALKTFLAWHPEAGVIVRGTGGVRKLRWNRPGMGKSGGVRVIYYFHNETIPLLLIDLYAKNEKENLSKEERNLLAKIVDVYINTYGRKL